MGREGDSASVHHRGGPNNGVTPSVPFTRPLCPYPQTAVYKKGDTNQASSFVCQADNGHDDDDHGHDHGHDDDHGHGHGHDDN